MAAAVDSFFDEDEVCRKTDDDRYEYGLVVESSEYVSSDEDDDEEDRLKKGTVRIAWHPEGKETVEEEKKLVLADRSLMPGDVVRRFIEGKCSPRGFVQDMKVLCHVNIKGTNKYIYNVDSKEISSGSFEDPSNKYFKNDHPDVTMDSWIGKIDEVYEAVTLLFQDGAMCKMTEAEDLHYGFDAINDHCINEAPDSTFSSEGMFYKGKILRGKIGDLQGAEWFQPTRCYSSKVAKKNPRMMVTVRIEEVEVMSVKVHWLFRGFGTPENSSDSMEVPPSKVVPPKLSKLISLDWYSYCSVQVGDKSTYEIKPEDQILDVPPRLHFVPDVLSKENLTEAAKDNSCTNSKASVEECTSNDFAVEAQLSLSRETSEELSENSNQEKKQTGTESESMEYETMEEKEADEDYEDVESSEEEKNEEKTVNQTKKPSHTPRKKRKTKNPKKPERKSKAEAKFYPPFPTCQPGEKVTVEVCYTFSKAEVMWQNGDVETDIPSTDLVPIHHLDELEFFPGDFVIPEKDSTSDKYGVVVNCDHIERTCLVRWMKVVDLAKGERPDMDFVEEEVSVYDIKDHPDFKFRPSQAVIRVGEPLDANECKFTAGQIRRLDPNGILIVKWPDGNESRCYPQELYIALEELDETDSDWSTIDSDDDSDSMDSMDSWETENEEEVESDLEEKRESEREKPLMISKDKKDELLKFLEVAQESLGSLEDFFKAEKSSPVTYENLKGIMSLYRKCQEWEKFLKSSYFEEQKLKDLIEELKEYLKEEKRNELNHRILWIHKARQSSISVSNKENEVKSDKSASEKSVVVNGDVAEEGDSGVSVTCNGEHSHDSTSNESTQRSVLSDSSCTDDNIPSSYSNGELDEKSSGATSQTDTSCQSEKAKKRAELCKKICSELRSRMTVIQEDINHRWSLTMKETQNALEKFSKGDSKSSGTHGCASGADGSKEGAMNGVDNAQSSDNSTSELTDTRLKKIQEMNPDDIKHILMTLAEDGRGCEILEEVLLGMDSDKSRVKTPEILTNDINFKDIITSDIEGLHLMEEVPLAHKFCSKEYSPGDPKSFTSALAKELKLLQSSLPSGIIVKAFEDRMDLFSVMIVGPPGTPYEDALFFFDVQVPGDYPSSPPEFHYISYCKDRLNPNLYEDGKVCVSLLGTWSGKGNETWTDKSNLLQALVSIQGLILVAEPYYNEAGYEKQRGSQQGHENSKMYNEMAILKVVQSTARMISNPPHSFLQEMTSHLRVRGSRMVERLEAWINSSSSSEPTVALSSTLKPKADNSESESVEAGKSSGILAVAYSKSDSNLEHAEGVLTCSKESSTDSNTKSDETSVSVEEMQTNSSNKDDRKCISTEKMPEFPLLPASKGFCITMKKNLQSLRNSLEKLSN